MVEIAPVCLCLLAAVKEGRLELARSQPVSDRALRVDGCTLHSGFLCNVNGSSSCRLTGRLSQMHNSHARDLKGYMARCRKTRMEEAQKQREEAEAQMLARREELMKDKDGYWSRRMAQEKASTLVLQPAQAAAATAEVRRNLCSNSGIVLSAVGPNLCMLLTLAKLDL